MKPKNNPLSNAFFSGPPCSRARNTDTFQVVVYEAQFFSQCVMGRFLFLTQNFMPRVTKWELHGKVCFTLDKVHQEKGRHDCNLELFLIVPCIKKKLFEM